MRFETEAVEIARKICENVLPIQLPPPGKRFRPDYFYYVDRGKPITGKVVGVMCGRFSKTGSDRRCVFESFGDCPAGSGIAAQVYRLGESSRAG